MEISNRAAADEFAFEPSEVSNVTYSSETSSANTSITSEPAASSFLSGGGLFKTKQKTKQPIQTPPSLPPQPNQNKEHPREVMPPSGTADRAMTSQRRGTFFGTYLAEGPLNQNKNVVVDTVTSPLQNETKTTATSQTPSPPPSPPSPSSSFEQDLPPRQVVNEQDLPNTNNSKLSTKAGLFCFEFYVHTIAIDTKQKQQRGGLKRPPSRPTVAFRFLDFPTQNIEAKNNNKNNKNKNKAWNINLDIGKSCLLESTPAELHARCLTTPLYVVLLDARTAGTSGRLLGATVIDLADYVRTASIPGVTALPPEAHYGAEGYIRSTYSLLSLTGIRIGTVDASLRLRNLGSHMLSHWRSTQQRQQRQQRQQQQQRSSSPVELPTFIKKKRKDKKKTKQPSIITVQENSNTNYTNSESTEATMYPNKEQSQGDERARQRERALEATIKAIQFKTNARPGHDSEIQPRVVSDNMSSVISPPPLFYHNSGDDLLNHKSTKKNTYDQQQIEETKAVPYSRGAPSPGTADKVHITTSQRRGTFFGTFTPGEAQSRKLQLEKDGVAMNNDDTINHMNQNQAWLRESGGGFDRKRRNQENVGASGLSLSDRRRRELQLRAMWMDQTPMVDAWEPDLDVSILDPASETNGNNGNFTIEKDNETSTENVLLNAADLLDMKDSMSA